MKLQARHIPNILTIVRIFLTPVIVVFLLVPFGDTLYHFDTDMGELNFQLSFILAGILFVLACLTDAVDGYLARKNNWVSNFGKLWDPIADKVLINSVFIIFAYRGFIPIYFPIIMIARDVIVDAGRMHASSKGKVVPANIYGKLKTICQMFAILVIFFCLNQSIFLNDDSLGFNLWYYLVQNFLTWCALVFSVVSGYIYMYNMYSPKPKNKKK